MSSNVSVLSSNVTYFNGLNANGTFVSSANATLDSNSSRNTSLNQPRHHDIYHVEIINHTPWPIQYVGSGVEWGSVHKNPPTVYSWQSNNEMAIETGYFAGFEGFFRFSIKRNDDLTNFNLLINLQFWSDDMEARVSWQSDDVFSYKVTYDSSLKQLYMTVSLTNPKPSSGYTIAISSDPQPWRLVTGDPNDQRDRWTEYTNDVFANLRKNNFAFVIINGDVTEFGKSDQFTSFIEQIDKIVYGPVLWGLGNHDYENNVGDCSSSGGVWSSNGCARFMVRNVQSLHKKWERLLPEFAYDSDSLAYAWTYGAFRFVQANNYPTYNVTLNSWIFGDIVVKSSVSWIKKQFDLYPKQMFILNMHQWREDSMQEFINSPRVAYIFVGHTHVPAVRCVNGMKVYDSGALFKRQYYKLDIDADCVKIRFFPKDQLVHDSCNSTILTDKCTENLMLE